MQLFGYSRRRTTLLLAEAAGMIMQLSEEVVEHRWARAEAESHRDEAIAAADDLRARLAQALEDLDTLRAGTER